MEVLGNIYPSLGECVANKHRYGHCKMHLLKKKTIIDERSLFLHKIPYVLFAIKRGSIFTYINDPCDLNLYFINRSAASCELLQVLPVHTRRYVAAVRSYSVIAQICALFHMYLLAGQTRKKAYIYCLTLYFPIITRIC